MHYNMYGSCSYGQIVLEVNFYLENSLGEVSHELDGSGAAICTVHLNVQSYRSQLLLQASWIYKPYLMLFCCKGIMINKAYCRAENAVDFPLIRIQPLIVN